MSLLWVLLAVLGKNGRDAMVSMKGIAGAAAILIGLSALPARAGYVVDLTQVGSNVVAIGSGTLDVSDLSFVYSGSYGGVIQPNAAVIAIGPVSVPSIDSYSGVTGQ
jgi:hypothetical protein